MRLKVVAEDPVLSTVAVKLTENPCSTKLCPEVTLTIVIPEEDRSTVTPVGRVTALEALVSFRFPTKKTAKLTNRINEIKTANVFLLKPFPKLPLGAKRLYDVSECRKYSFCLTI